MKYILCMTTLLLGFLLVACGSPSTPLPQPVFTPAPEANNPSHTSGAVDASGVVKPGQEAQLSFAQGGWLQSMQVSEGDSVGAGEIIARLEGRERLEASIKLAETELLAAQQGLDALDNSYNMDKAQALQAVITANEVLGGAKYRLYNFVVPSTFDDLTPMEALEMTKVKLDLAREAFDPYKHKSSSDEQRKDLKEELDWAQSDYNAAMRWVALEADLVRAQADLQAALKTLDKLRDGPDPERVAMAQARLENSQAQLIYARSELDQLELRAPFDGEVVRVDCSTSEAVLPGQVVVVLGNLDQLQVETSDLSERDVSSVAVGQPVRVYVDALNLTIPGTVINIAPQADTIGGDVVYAVLVELAEQPYGLRWGMSVDVEIDTE